MSLGLGKTMGGDGWASPSANGGAPSNTTYIGLAVVAVVVVVLVYMYKPEWFGLKKRADIKSHIGSGGPRQGTYDDTSMRGDGPDANLDQPKSGSNNTAKDVEQTLGRLALTS